MYKFIVSQGECGASQYDIAKCERQANEMEAHGWHLIQVYQSTTPGCGTGKSVLVMVFRR
jgi:hypothetical protein